MLAKIGESGRPFSAREHALLSEKEWGPHLGSRDAALLFYLTHNWKKFPAVGFVLEQARIHHWEHVLSLGAGLGVLEHFIALGLAPRGAVTITDFDSFLVDRAKTFFPELNARPLDFLKDDALAFLRGVSRPVDAVMFFGSSYVMDDSEFVALGRQLHAAGVNGVVDFHAAPLGLKVLLSEAGPVGALRRLPIVRWLLRRGPVGKFHGYARSRRHMRSLYAAAGFRTVSEHRVAEYEQVLVCQRMS